MNNEFGILMLSIFVYIIGILMGLFLCAQAHASGHMHIVPCDTRDYHQCAIISINGEITAGDGVDFVSRTEDIQTARVDLQGPGGAFVAGIDIGEQIHTKGFATYVPENTVCASACANIWIAGKVRTTGPNAKLAWHAAFKDDDQKNADGMANVVMGVYLAHLGFNYADAINMFGHDPADMHVTSADANGIQTRGDFRRIGTEFVKVP